MNDGSFSATDLLKVREALSNSEQRVQECIGTVKSTRPIPLVASSIIGEDTAWSDSLARIEEGFYNESESTSKEPEKPQNQIREDELGSDSECAEDLEITNWTSVIQHRPGARHGRGGRKPEQNNDDRRGQTSSSVSHFMMLQWSFLFKEDINHSIFRIVQRIAEEDGRIPHKQAPIENHEFPWEKKDFQSFKLNEFQLLDVPLFAGCHRVKRSGFERGEGGVMERHAACFWIGTHGDLLCSCVGSSLFRIMIIQETSEDRICKFSCPHTAGMLHFISEVSLFIGATNRQVSRAINALFKMYGKSEYHLFKMELPKAMEVHRDSIRVVCEIFAGDDLLVFCPVRVIRGGKTYVCAFCDTLHLVTCRHVSLASRTEMVGETEDQDGDLSSQPSNCQSAMETSISQLPLSPVNCKNAVERDLMINTLIISGEPYIIQAPQFCQCGSPVINGRKVIHSSGVIMSTFGACAMHVEENKCASLSCGKSVIAEGREHYSLIFSLTTAATHVLLRRELRGVVMGNGTLSSRLKHYHAVCVENILTGLVSSGVRPRSIRTLQKLCSEMLRLMTSCPDVELYRCGNCDVSINGTFGRVHTICVDGVYQGYTKRNENPQRNIAEPCMAYPISTSNPLRARPKISFIRREKPFSILFNAINGKDVACRSKQDLLDIAAAVRCVSRGSLPDYYFLGSVCGRTTNDYSYDIGQSCTLEAIRLLTTSLFDKDALEKRLLRPIFNYISQLKDEDYRELEKIGVVGRQARPIRPKGPRYASFLYEVPPLLNHLTRILRGQNIQANEVCWNSSLFRCINQRVSFHKKGNLRDILVLYRILMQGPLPQFIRESEIASVKQIGHLCGEESSEGLRKAFEKVQIGGLMQEPHVRYLNDNRFIQAGLVGVLELEDMERALGDISQVALSVRLSFGRIFLEASSVVKLYFSFYDNLPCVHPARIYGDKWSTTDEGILTSKLRQIHGNYRNNLGSNVFDEAVQSGFYFPSLPQVRPLPFDSDLNISETSTPPINPYGPCSKDYFQRQNTYTPGAIVLSCACSTSISYGIKVLQRDEGPKCVLDCIVSRFPEIPRYIVYDFSCGLFTSAAHVLWWALKDTTIVTDNFHAKNHSKCSPTYLPKGHKGLDLANTVAHEQNNRPIAMLGRTLRNSSQKMYLGLLSYLITLENIKAKVKKSESYKNRDRFYDENDLQWAYFTCLNLSCLCCSSVS